MHFIHEGIGCSEDHAVEVAHARFKEKKLHEHRKQAGRTVLSPIVIVDDGDDDKDDTARLSDLIALVEVGLQTEEAKEDTGRLSELIAQVDAGLHAEEDTFFSQAVEVANEADAAYYRR